MNLDTPKTTPLPAGTILPADPPLTERAARPPAAVRVPARLREAVEVHALGQLLPGYPLILAVHGPPGTGKTFGVAAALEGCGAFALRLSGGEMESPEAGEPAALVRRSYVRAGQIAAAGPHAFAALVIDDFDAALGDWGALVQTTVNTQSVLTELMGLCDRPHEVEGRRAARVPVFLTGNDLTRVYAPLRRPGRAALFEWDPEGAEREELVAAVFPHLTGVEVRELAAAFPSRPVAFFAHAASALAGRGLRAGLAREGFAALWERLASGGSDPAGGGGLGEILLAARALDASLDLRDHLAPPARGPAMSPGDFAASAEVR